MYGFQAGFPNISGKIPFILVRIFLSLGTFSFGGISENAAFEAMFGKLDTNNDGKARPNEIDPDMNAYLKYKRSKLDKGMIS